MGRLFVVVVRVSFLAQIRIDNFVIVVPCTQTHAHTRTHTHAHTRTHTHTHAHTHTHTRTHGHDGHIRFMCHTKRATQKVLHNALNTYKRCYSIHTKGVTQYIQKALLNTYKRSYSIHTKGATQCSQYNVRTLTYNHTCIQDTK